jgi:hypothetical protein
MVSSIIGMSNSIVCSLTGVLVDSVRQSIRYHRMILHLSVRHLVRSTTSEKRRARTCCACACIDRKISRKSTYQSQTIRNNYKVLTNEIDFLHELKCDRVSHAFVTTLLLRSDSIRNVAGLDNSFLFLCFTTDTSHRSALSPPDLEV